MKRRSLLKGAAILPLVTSGCARAMRSPVPTAGHLTARVRPGEPGWPSPDEWRRLGAQVQGRLSAVASPFDACRAGDDCARLFRDLSNPFAIAADPTLTQTTGWIDGWLTSPGAYVVAAGSTADVVAAVNFARLHRLRLVVRGGAHSYLGTSNAPDSLMIWTRAMHGVTLHDTFTPRGVSPAAGGEPAASIGAGAIWLQAYDAVTTQGGRYVQGGGCTTVGVAGLIQSGGFGSFSKRFGLAAANLLEAEVVTADGQVRIASAERHPDLFWALKGGGGGTFGVVTRVTLRTHELPPFLGGAFGAVRATSDDAFRALTRQVLVHYRDRLLNPTWGEQLRFHPGRVVSWQMVFQGISADEARSAWQPLDDWIRARPAEFAYTAPPAVAALPARHFWDPAFLADHVPQVIWHDDRPGAPVGNFAWAGNREEAGQFLHGYHSGWLAESWLHEDRIGTLVEALVAGSARWEVSLHCNKGLAGASPEVIAGARNTAVHPAAITAFALVIVAGGGPPAIPGIPGHEPDLPAGRHAARGIAAAMEPLRPLVEGSYVSESDFFEADWQRQYWGPHHDRLARIKAVTDPDGLFIVHHGVGSESWTADGFERRDA